MNELDQFIKHELKVKYYIRYTDDFVVVHHNETALLFIKDKIEEFLRKKLLLELHPHKIHIRKYRQGIDFLGYVELPKARVVRTKTKRRIFRNIRTRIEQYKQGIIGENKLQQSLQSYLGVLGHANSYKLKNHLLHSFWQHLKEF